MFKSYIAVIMVIVLVLLSTLGSIQATTNDTPATSFFINEKDGTNNAVIVVGAKAAPSDVVAASYIAAKMGMMAKYDVVTEKYSISGPEYEYQDDKFEENVSNYDDDGNGDSFFDDFRDSSAYPSSEFSLPYACGGSFVDLMTDYGIDATKSCWDYDIAIAGGFLNNDKCSYELITVDFSVRDCSCMEAGCLESTNACDQKGLFFVDINNNEAYDDGEEISSYDEVVGMGPIIPYPFLPQYQSYPNIYPRHYWGSPASHSEEICDPVGGIQYRTVVDNMDNVTYAQWEATVASWGSQAGYKDSACTMPERKMLDLYCDYCEVYFLGIEYNALSFGTSEEGYDYMFFGTPEWTINEMLMEGESKRYGTGWSVSVTDIGLCENKAQFTITDPDGRSYDYVSVYGDYASGSPQEGDGPYQVYDPATNRWEIYSANDENQVVAFCTKEMPAYNACAERTGDLLTLESDYDATYKGEVVFAIRINKSMIAASGARMVEYTVYALDDYGVLTEQIYPSACEQSIEPTIRVNELEWYLDIFPVDNIDSIDLDNDISLFVEGNPNFDAADALAVEYGASKCYPMLELWLATPVECETMCSEELLVELRDCNGDNYFCVNINDHAITDYRIDEYIGIFKKRYYLPNVTTYATDLDVPSLVTTDDTIPKDLSHTNNLILVGGPVANEVVAKLVEDGKTSFDKWTASEGDVEYLEKEANKGILIVAGKDRDATLAAALDLVDML